MRTHWKIVFRWMAMVVVMLTAGDVFALTIQNCISPRNVERKRRPHTDYIILHTTEGPERSSLNKLRANGEAHYMVGMDGTVYRIIDKKKIAYHAGLSMWDGKVDIDNYAIGIEVVGYHNRELTAVQYRALRELIEELQGIYRISDECVMTHSMVAYGNPNKWHKKPHRGRKRCGMLFARTRVRKMLGLTCKQSYDPDVRARRLVAADEQLAVVLYGRDGTSEKKFHYLSVAKGNVLSKGNTPWDIAGTDYKKSTTVYIFPDGKEKKGSEIHNWSALPAGTRVVMRSAEPSIKPVAKASGLAVRKGLVGVKFVGVHGKNARKVAGERYKNEDTIYFFPDGRVRCGKELTEKELKKIPTKTAVLVGYTYGGHISRRKSAYDICKERWDDIDTYYRFTDGRIVAGSEVSDSSIPLNTLVFFRN